MNAVVRLLGQSRLVLTAALLLSVLGLLGWLTMPRQEDPSMQRRFGLVTVAFPGADAEALERLVVEPLEEEIAQVDAIKILQSRSRAGFAILDLQLRDDTTDFDGAWDEIEDAVERAQASFPQGVAAPHVDRDTIDQDSVVLAITGSNDPLELVAAAETVKRGLLPLRDVSAVRLVADPGEQITIEYDQSLAAQLGARNVTPTGGSVRMGSKTAALRPASEFRTLEEIAQTPVVLPSGSTVPLSELARVRRSPAEPATERMRIDGEMAIGLGIIAREGINLVDYGEAVRARVAELEAEIAPLQITEVAFQPEQVEGRINELGSSLLLGVAIVALVLFVAMGARLGLVVAAVVPLVAFTALAIYAAGGGILHQISIAALVIALGMLVDNAIVVAENIQARIDVGETPKQAAEGAVRELMVPLGVATGTTLAAFIPMFMAEGGTADFTRAIPIVIMLTLTVSYVYAVLVTPTLSAMFLRPGKSLGESPLDRLSGWLGKVAVGRYRLVLVVAALVVGLSGAAASKLEQQFFPKSDRSMVIVDLTVPEGSHLDEVDEVARELEHQLIQRSDVTSVASFVGRSAPHFYYNLQARPGSPHLAQLVVATTGKADNAAVIDWIRSERSTSLAGVEVVAKGLEQGPPVVAPVEVRLSGHDLDELRIASDRVTALLKQIDGAEDVRNDMSLGVPTVDFEIDDAAAARRGLSRADVTIALLGQTRGLEVGQFRAGDDPVPIYLRSPEGDETAIETLETLTVATPGGAPTPIAQLARTDVHWRPAVIRHRARARTVSVMAEVGEGTASSEIVAALDEQLASLDLPASVDVQYGGEAEGSSEANAAMLRTLPIGVLVLLGFLMIEFNSFRRVAIIMVTVPLALTGVVPGLLLGGQPFGFMSLLGVIALIGVVVNNAIVLLDVVERRREEGADMHVALAESVKLRTRPILLTTATTVAGLMPLAFSGAALWPPLAWAMITGLLASTLLTLLVVPALYRVLFPHPAPSS